MTLIEEAAKALAHKFDTFDWFYDTAIDGNCVIVYVQSMDKEACDLIPDYFDGFQIKVWFSDYLLCEEKYAAKPMSQWNSFVREESFDF